MPNITNPDVTGWNNDVIRRLSDWLVSFHLIIEIEKVKYQNIIAPLIAGNASGDLIFDGSENDARIQMTKSDLTTIGGALVSIDAEIAAVLPTLIKAKVNTHGFDSFNS